MNKPPYGAPCNGCGQCCIATICPVGIAVLGGRKGDPCHALEGRQDGTFACGLVTTPEHYAPVNAAIFGRDLLSEAALVLIGNKIGCDASTRREYETPGFFSLRDDIDRKSYHLSTRRNEARKIWGIQ